MSLSNFLFQFFGGTKMKLCISIMVLLCVTGIAFGGAPPGHSKTEWVIPQTTHAIVGQLLTTKQSRDKKDRIFDVTIKPARNLWGIVGEEVVKTSYKEYIPVVVGKIIPMFIDYTGSGIEFDAKVKQDYVFFLKKERKGFFLLRMEPAANENKIIELRKKFLKEKEAKNKQVSSD